MEFQEECRERCQKAARLSLGNLCLLGYVYCRSCEFRLMHSARQSSLPAFIFRTRIRILFLTRSSSILIVGSVTRRHTKKGRRECCHSLGGQGLVLGSSEYIRCELLLSQIFNHCTISVLLTLRSTLPLLICSAALRLRLSATRPRKTWSGTIASGSDRESLFLYTHHSPKNALGHRFTTDPSSTRLIERSS